MRKDGLSERGVRLLRSACLAILLVGCKHSETPPRRAPVVEVIRVLQQNVPIYREWVATLDGYVNAQIQPKVTGYVIAQRFVEGSQVSKGQILFEIDQRPFVAILRQAEGDLAARQADAARTLRDVERDRPLAEARAIPRSQLENDVELHRAAVAAVEAARGQVTSARLDVGYTHVRSLINGIVGFAQVQVGNLVSPTSVLTTVSQVQPIKALFAISEQDYLDAQDRLSAVELNDGDGDGDSEDNLSFQLTLADGSVYPHRGHFLFANRQVDSLTGTLRIATAFPNPRSLLRPGQFGRIRAAVRIARGALLVPQRAVNELQGTYQVMVLNHDSTVTVQPVEVGPQVDSLWVIESGLKPGQLVIVEGTQNVHPKVKVVPRPYRPLPSPIDSQAPAPLRPAPR
ncbi:MAG TPA: efflux RND transporter periplasmic adaptor subunit [Gemmatimonadaceae bacterium]|nr:efflux RND transporter periplasmic adaptor subunit [Gemmatimonadaceae bacterium]